MAKTLIGNIKGPQGEQGEQGNGILSVVLNDDYTLTITLEDGTSYTTPSIRGPAGPSGGNGADGNDGVSIVSVTQTTTSSASGGENVITVTLSNGATSTFKVKNGAVGATGQQGPKGDDYVLTDDDKADIAAAVKASLNTETWTFTLEDGSAVTKAVYVG